MKIISQILLLSLIFVISCDDDSPDFSILGTWNTTQSTENGHSNWTNIPSSNQSVYTFKSNGTYIYSFGNSTTSTTMYYQLCESSNVIHLSGTSFDDGNCECEDTYNHVSMTFEKEGLNSMIWLNCVTETNGFKLIRQ